MALPNDLDLQNSLLLLLAQAPKGAMHCQEVFKVLAKQYPQLTWDDLNVPYRQNKSHWVYRVRAIREHLVRQRLIFRPWEGVGQGYWTISDSGRLHLRNVDSNLKNLPKVELGSCKGV